MAHGPLNPPGTGAARHRGTMRSLVLRAWLEPGDPHLRVRIVEIPPDRGERPVAVTTSADEACNAVRRWLEALAARGSNGNGDGVVTPEELDRINIASWLLLLQRRLPDSAD
jgi:hypothetical protein